MSTVSTLYVIAAGGTGGHVFPALAFAQELLRTSKPEAITWVGTNRSRERELCERHGIVFKELSARGLVRSLSLKNIGTLIDFIRGVGSMMRLFKLNRPAAVIAFGGYVCAPVLLAARLRGIPFFLQEQNTVPGLVNRLFANGAARCFLGFPLEGRRRLAGKTMLTGTPVRAIAGTYNDFAYPSKFNRTAKTILISGGSQGAASMNKSLLAPVKRLCEKGIQVVWQTGASTFAEVTQQLAGQSGAFVFELIDDLYPFYARAHVVVCRAGASTLSEIAYFGLPCVMIPLPWAAENHQWINAGMVEAQGWGIRVQQTDDCGAKVVEAVQGIIDDPAVSERMSRKALNNSPTNAAHEIVREISTIAGR
jgi:UDP-N-acetylglucosamine--N-acetylmuramyl-(pentapeptide) pyrophosphoryl-undecaprenol N-acetylglucosamine transferase